MNEILAKQLAIDFCTDVNSILSKENVFTEYKQLEGRRIFKEGECYFMYRRCTADLFRKHKYGNRNHPYGNKCPAQISLWEKKKHTNRIV